MHVGWGPITAAILTGGMVAMHGATLKVHMATGGMVAIHVATLRVHLAIGGVFAMHVGTLKVHMATGGVFAIHVATLRVHLAIVGMCAVHWAIVGICAVHLAPLRLWSSNSQGHPRNPVLQGLAEPDGAMGGHGEPRSSLKVLGPWTSGCCRRRGLACVPAH